ncbi:unnamed protein product [Porites evermanni]|uniref:Uncharacterized protein n=1 Tax=Porites evermanni TaxID=104178 RepID=A0ABN8SP11_9CNID|nr:unnamed protein product [Porites evermanni]
MQESSSQSSAGELSSSQVELNQNSKPSSRHSSCLSLNSAKVHPEVTSENSAPTPVERPSTSDFIVSDSAESQVKAHKVRYQRTGYTPCRVTQVFWAEVITFHMHTTQTANGTVIMTVAVRNVTILSFKRTRPTCYSINRTIWRKECFFPTSMVKRLTRPAMTKNMRTKCVDCASFNEDLWSRGRGKNLIIYTHFLY